VKGTTSVLKTMKKVWETSYTEKKHLKT